MSNFKAIYVAIIYCQIYSGGRHHSSLKFFSKVSKFISVNFSLRIAKLSIHPKSSWSYSQKIPQLYKIIHVTNSREHS